MNTESCHQAGVPLGDRLKSGWEWSPPTAGIVTGTGSMTEVETGTETGTAGADDPGVP